MRFPVILLLLLLAACSKGDGENNEAVERAICGTDADCPELSHCQNDGRCLARTECTDAPDCPFDASCGTDGKCASAVVTQSASGGKTPIDILFVIDNSETMCATQRVLSDAIDSYGHNVANSEIDAQFAFVTTDMIDPAHQGSFIREPGERDLMTCLNPPNTDRCVPLSGGVIKASDFSLSTAALSNTLGCMAWAGNKGSSVEMGLEAMRRALTNPTQATEFLRPGALLGIVFVSDGNDCSDGTFAGMEGSVYTQTVADGDNAACEDQRNIEDSCPYHKTDHGAPIEHDGRLLSARDWCIEGDRATVQTLEAQLNPVCPPGGCANSLTPRSEYFDFVTDLVAQKNGYPGNRDAAKEDIRVVSIVFEDNGFRGNPIAPGYRYDLFARMFPLHSVGGIAPGTGSASFGAQSPLTNGTDQRICLEQKPAECDPELGEDACIGDGVCQQHFEWEENTYYTCSNTVLRVSVDVGIGPQPIPEHTGYRLDYGSARCLALTGSPVEVTVFENVFPEHTITVDYVPAQ